MIKKRLSYSLIILAFLFLFFFGAASISAQEGPAVLSNEAQVDFPRTVTFSLELPPGTAVDEAVLNYQIGQNSCLIAGTQVPVETDGPNLEWTWVMSRSGGNLPPGTRLWWEWTVTDTDGNSITTPRQELTFTDDRYDWRTVTHEAEDGSGKIFLHWYRGDDVGPILLDAATEGLERLEREVGIDLQGDVNIFIYEDSEEMQKAFLSVQDWVGGAAFSEYNTILIGVPPYLAETWGSDTIRHELAHLVIGQFGRSCLGGSRPTWLEEGLALYAEGDPSDSLLDDISRAKDDNSFQPVRSLNGSFPAHDDQASLAYSQSFSLVDFLLTQYGRERIQELILILASAEGYDQALEQVYGFNVDGLETAWRAAIGLEARQIPPTPTPVLAAAIPTAVPLNAALSVPTPSPEPGQETPPDSKTSPSNSGGLCGLGLAPTLLLVGLVLVKRPRLGKNRRP